MDLIRLHIDLGTFAISLDLSPWLIGGLIVLFVLGLIVRRFFRRYRLVSLNISLGNIGKAEFRPNREDLQIAHRIWTELVTRKAAVPIDPDHDVIVEVYDSWYALFTRIRALIADLPADLLRREKSTKAIVKIATTTLNNGIRPHLTRWQARFRHWYDTERARSTEESPQDIQKRYPHYEELIADMMRINGLLIDYASELEKLVR